MSEIAVVDFREKIAERIKSQFMDLIPEDMWTALVDKTVREFTEDTTSRYNNDRMSSEARKLIKTELEKLFVEAAAVKVAEYVAKVEVTNLIEKYINENASTIFTTLIGQAISSFVGQISATTLQSLFVTANCPGCHRSVQRISGSGQTYCACGRYF